MRRFIAAACLMLLVGTSAFGQKKAETKMYKNALSRPSVEAFDKFLKKYPSSVYAADITARKDTLLSISPYDEVQANEILAGYLPQGAEFRAFAQRKEGVDRIYGVCISAEGLDKEYVRLCTLEKDKDGWVLKSYDSPSSTEDNMGPKAFVDSTSFFTIRGRKYFNFKYLSSSEDGVKQMLAAACWCPEEDEYQEVVFSGKSEKSKLVSGPYRIVGRSNESIVAGKTKQQIAVLVNEIKNDPNLVEIAENDWLTDADIEWWLEKNPDALTASGKLSCNIIQSGSSLVEKFATAKGKQNSAKYRAAMFDIRGYTVIVAYQKEDDNYILAWVEPECKNHYRDRLLNSISFESSNSLEMFYYQGNRTFKWHLNLASKTIKH